jgi:heptosyltransferase-2
MGLILFEGVGAGFKPTPTTGDPKRILVARIDSLGDGVLSLPAIEALRKRFPKAEVDFLVSPPVEELYRKLFPNSRIYRFEKNWLTSSAPWIERLSEAAKLLKEIKGGGYDLGIDFRGDLRTLLLLAGAGIKHRWGRGGTGGGFLLSRQTKSGYESHELLENMELIQSNGKVPEIEFPQIKPASASVQSVTDRLRSIGSKKKIVIHIGAGYPSKCWRPAKYAELARGIVQKGLGVPLFSGSEKDRALLDEVRENLPAESLDFTGKTSLEELLALLEQADLFIGNDSGPAHLAALLGRKLVVIFSGTNDYRRWAPWTERLRVVNHPVPCSPCEEKVCPLNKQVCLEEISVEEVFGAAEEMLEG